MFSHFFLVPQKVLWRPLRPFSLSGIATGRVKVMLLTHKQVLLNLCNFSIFFENYYWKLFLTKLRRLLHINWNITLKYLHENKKKLFLITQIVPIEDTIYILIRRLVSIEVILHNLWIYFLVDLKSSFADKSQCF